MLSVRQLQEYAASQLHEVSTDTRLTTLILRWVNEAYQKVASAGTWKWLEAQETFTYGNHGVGVNTAFGVTYLPHRVHRLLSVWPGGRNYREQVRIIGGWELDALDPSMVAGSPADLLAVYGYYGVARDNPTAGVIACADAGAATLNVVIEGVDTNGLDAEETVTIAAGGPTNSTTQFAAGPDGVRRCYIVEDPTTITGVPTIVTFSSGATVIETLNYTNGEFVKEHLRTELSPAPATGGATYLTRYYKRPKQIRSNAEIIPTPSEFDDLITNAIDARLAAYQGGSRKDMVLVYEQMFRSRVQELKAWQNRQPGRMRGMREINRQMRGY
jgi:hypothetical protein